MNLFHTIKMNIIAFALSWIVAIPSTAEAQDINVWIGTGRSTLSRGIYHCRLNSIGGKLSEPTLAAEMDGPGFLAKHPTKPFLYAVGSLNNVPVVAAVDSARYRPAQWTPSHTALGSDG